MIFFFLLFVWFPPRPLKNSLGTIFFVRRSPSRLFGTVQVCRSRVVVVLVSHAPVCVLLGISVQASTVYCYKTLMELRLVELCN